MKQCKRPMKTTQTPGNQLGKDPCCMELFSFSDCSRALRFFVRKQLQLSSLKAIVDLYSTMKIPINFGEWS